MVSALRVLKHPLRGRDPELAAVAALLTAAQRGNGGALVITGPADAGRTALLAAATGGGPAHGDVAGVVAGLAKGNPQALVDLAGALTAPWLPSALRRLRRLRRLREHRKRG